MIFLRLARHVASIVTLIVWLGVPAVAQSQPPSSGRGNPQGRDNNQPTAQPPINITVTAPTPDPEAAKREEARQDRNLAAQETVSAMTVALIVITGFQALFAFASLKIAWMQRATLIASERAYVHAGDFKITDLEVGKEPMVQFNVVNSGRTPARDVSVAAASRYGGERPDEPSLELSVSLKQQFVAAGKHMGVPIKLPNIQSDQVLQAIKNGQMWLFVEVHYRANGFRKHRTYRICVEYSRFFNELRLSNHSPYHSED